MRCMTNFARRHAGLRRLATLGRRSTARPAARPRDILRCDSFSHYACGRDFTYWMRRVGYFFGGCWRAGENIAWGSGSLGTVRSIFGAWMHSSGHRDEHPRRPLRPARGRASRSAPSKATAAAHVWVQHFGDRC